MKRYLALGSALLITSCIDSSTTVIRPDTGPVDTGPSMDASAQTSADDVRRVLSNVGGNVILPTLREFATRARALEAATAAYETSLSEADRETARTAWRSAMDMAQRAEVYQLGPAAAVDATVLGSGGIRDEIYSWPLVNRCRVDQETVDPSHASTDTLRAEAINTRGLSAIEYLLFENSLMNGCPATISINSLGTWAALGDMGVRTNRARYAHNAAVLVRERADELVAAWETDFLAQFSTAGSGSRLYPTAQDGLNALSDALFYIEDPGRDLKLGVPAGVMMCTETSCPDMIESLYADVSRENILANLRAFRSAYLGGEPGTDGQGFDDLLRTIGANELDSQMQRAIQGSINAVDAIEGPLGDAVRNRNAQVVAAYDALTVLVRLLKTEFVTVLDLELPMRVEGDND